MKNKLLIIIAMLLATSDIFAQWLPSNINGGFGIQSVSALNTDSFIISRDGRVFLTYNRGQNFDSLATPSGLNQFLRYKSADTLFGCRFSNPRLMYSTDGGKNWSGKYLILSNGDTAFKKTAISYLGFFNSSHGIILGDTNGASGQYQIFLTHDGGNTWQQHTNAFIQQFKFKLPNSFTNVNSPYINDKGNFIARLNNRVLLTISNFGQTWQTDTIKVDTFNLNLNHVIGPLSFKNELQGLTYFSTQGGVGILIKTTDGGKTWQRLAPQPLVLIYPTNYATSTPKKPGFYYGFANHNSYVSHNDGQNWQKIDSIYNVSTYNTHFINAEAGVCNVTDTDAKPLRYFINSYTGIKEHYTKPTPTTFAYPNPASSYLSFTQTMQQLTITDALGKTVLQANQPQQINITTIANGIYWLHATDAKGNNHSQKLLVVH